MNNTRLKLDEMNKLAARHGGHCLSRKYLNAHTKLKWQCAKGHRWEAEPRSIKNNNSWCLVCSGSEKYTLEKIQELAAKRGGVCLSKNYISAHTELKWQCGNGHVWESTPNRIRLGNWCPVCGFQNLMENVCREVFRSIFNKTFPKFKPTWLVNAEGRRMELDGYNKELGLAFEYHGKQHYSYSKFFHSNESALLKRRRDDERKKILCASNKIKLIEIPYTISISDLYNYILNQCSKLNIKIPHHKKVDITKLNAHLSVKILAELEELAQKRGGHLLSRIYFGNHRKLKWKCGKGHEWEAVPSSVKGGTWCPICGGSFRLTIENMRELANEKGGQCLSSKYVNSHTKLKWKCDKGHVWEAKPTNIKRGQWCPECGFKKIWQTRRQNLKKDLSIQT